jgi:hypothetical protein
MTVVRISRKSRMNKISFAFVLAIVAIAGCITGDGEKADLIMENASGLALGPGDVGDRWALVDSGWDGPTGYYASFSIAGADTPEGLFGLDNFVVVFNSTGEAESEFNSSVESAIIVGFDVERVEAGEEAYTIKAENGAILILRYKNVVSTITLNGPFDENDIEELMELAGVVEGRIEGAES